MRAWRDSRISGARCVVCALSPMPMLWKNGPVQYALQARGLRGLKVKLDPTLAGYDLYCLYTLSARLSAVCTFYLHLKL
jgi:hypothetical protein